MSFIDKIDPAIVVVVVLIAVLLLFGFRTFVEYRQHVRSGGPTEGKTADEIAKMIRLAQTMAGFTKGDPSKCANVERMLIALKFAMRNGPHVAPPSPGYDPPRKA